LLNFLRFRFDSLDEETIRVVLNVSALKDDYRDPFELTRMVREQRNNTEFRVKGLLMVC